MHPHEEEYVDKKLLQQNFQGRENFKKDVDSLERKYSQLNGEDESDFSLDDIEEHYKDDSDDEMRNYYSMAEETDCEGTASDSDTSYEGALLERESEDRNNTDLFLSNLLSDTNDASVEDILATSSHDETNCSLFKPRRRVTVNKSRSADVHTTECKKDCETQIDCCWKLIKKIETDIQNFYPLPLLQVNLIKEKERSIISLQNCVSELKSKLKDVLRSVSNISDVQHRSKLQKSVSFLQEKWDTLHLKVGRDCRTAEKLIESMNEYMTCSDAFAAALQRVGKQFDELQTEISNPLTRQMALLSEVHIGIKQLQFNHDSVKEGYIKVRQFIQSVESICDKESFEECYAQLDNNFHAIQKQASQKQKELDDLMSSVLQDSNVRDNPTSHSTCNTKRKIEDLVKCRGSNNKSMKTLTDKAAKGSNSKTKEMFTDKATKGSNSKNKEMLTVEYNKISNRKTRETFTNEANKWSNNNIKEIFTDKAQTSMTLRSTKREQNKQCNERLRLEMCDFDILLPIYLTDSYFADEEISSESFNQDANKTSNTTDTPSKALHSSTMIGKDKRKYKRKGKKKRKRITCPL